MKLHILPIFVFFALTGCMRDDAWFVPDKDQIILVSTAVDAHAQQEFDIRSDVPLRLYFETDASYELMEKYQNSNPLPVKLQHRKAIDAIASVKGAGGGIFLPVDGVIPLRLSNDTDVRLRIVICSERNK